LKEYLNNNNNNNNEFLKDNINIKIKKLEEKYEEFRDLNNNNRSLGETWSNSANSMVIRQLPQIYPLYGGKRKSKRKPKSSRRRRRHTKRR
jgi:hypothetical protein